MRSMILAAALGASVGLAAQAAHAFTFEGQSTTTTPTPSAQAAPNGAALGFSGMDPSSVLPPIGESIPGQSFDFGPGAFNNGLASQPTRGSSVGPSWLYPPGR